MTTDRELLDLMKSIQLTDEEMDFVITAIGRFDRDEIGLNGLTGEIFKIACDSAARAAAAMAPEEAR